MRTNKNKAKLDKKEYKKLCQAIHEQGKVQHKNKERLKSELAEKFNNTEAMFEADITVNVDRIGSH